MTHARYGLPELRVNILLVDDEPANLLALEAILQDLGQNLLRALSGEEALRLLLREDFAVILLDVQMQGMDGFETARLIRARRRSRHTPIIFVTAYESPDFPVTTAYALGAVDYLVKPLIPNILRAKVAGFVDLFQMTEQVKHQAERLRQLESQAFERRLTEERQRWELERLREEARRKDEFLAVLGHELRNPLAPIRTAVEVLRQAGGRGPTAEQAHGIIDRQVRHLARLVDDLLDFSRISRGRITLRQELVALDQAVAHAVETCRPLYDARGHELTVALPAAPVWLAADPARLTQILTNLLTNAAKYTAGNGHVRLTAEAMDQEVILRVRDDGIGIPADMLERIFEPFTQVDSSPGKAMQWGLGIGLTLVKTLVELHGGTVTAASAGLGQGSEFIVRLPLGPAVRSTQPARDAPAVVAPADQGLRVLVVDDQADNAESLACLLRLHGHEVWVASDGPAALELARRQLPQAVLLDIGLPGMSGYEVALHLRQQPGMETVLLIAVTGYGRDEDRRRTRAAGFDHHLVKPVGPEEIHLLLAAAEPGRCRRTSLEVGGMCLDD
jgi:signal transduction histidine kinase